MTSRMVLKLSLITILLRGKQSGTYKLDSLFSCLMVWMGKDQNIHLEGWKDSYSFVMTMSTRPSLIPLPDSEDREDASIGKSSAVLSQRIISTPFEDNCIEISESHSSHSPRKNYSDTNPYALSFATFIHYI